MDLQELHRRTAINVRKLRYCIDHDLVPGLPIDLEKGKAGRPRSFADDVGFGIVCAACLLDLHLRHDTIRTFLGTLPKIPIPGGTPKSLFVSVLERPFPAQAQLSDDGKVRILVQEVVGDEGYDSGWMSPGNPSEPVDNCEPRAFVTLDLGKIRDQVFSRR
jgi:hypothetical protein